MMWQVSATTIEAISAHARACYPIESCGVIVAGEYVPLANVADHSEREFAIDIAQLPEQYDAVVHSHPDMPAVPSAADMRGQIATAVPWGIVPVTVDHVGEIVWWGDGVPIPPLIGRQFRHGPSGSDGRGDCYALIRDWFCVVRGIVLPEYPRDDRWWELGGDLYRENFEHAGFCAISSDMMSSGDVVLMQIASSVPNHAGIVLAHGKILHHLYGRLSRIESIAPWRKYITHVIRYGD